MSFAVFILFFFNCFAFKKKKKEKQMWKTVFYWLLKAGWHPNLCKDFCCSEQQSKKTLNGFSVQRTNVKVKSIFVEQGSSKQKWCSHKFREKSPSPNVGKFLEENLRSEKGNEAPKGSWQGRNYNHFYSQSLINISMFLSNGGWSFWQ